MEQEPIFLTRDHIDAIHQYQIETFGGLHGIRSENSLESAIAQPLNVYYYGAQSQAYFDGNKGTEVQAATDFLEINGVDANSLPEVATYEVLIHMANHELGRSGLAVFFPQRSQADVASLIYNGKSLKRTREYIDGPEAYARFREGCKRRSQFHTTRSSAGSRRSPPRTWSQRAIRFFRH